MRPSGVVLGDALIKGVLGGLHMGESWPVAEEFRAHTAMETLDLAGGGRTARLGQQTLGAASPTDPIKEHLDHRVVEPASRRGPQYGRDRRSSNSAASTAAGI
jgi:hypothetical protein